MRALVFSRPDDPCVDLVEAAIARRGGELLRLDTRAFPGEVTLSFGVGADAAPPIMGGLPLAGARSAWIRHLEVARALPEDLDPEHARAVQVIAGSTLFSLLETLDLFLLDAPEALLAAPLKARQAQLAVAVGLEVPRTLISNDAATIRAFARSCGGRVVAKMVETGSVGLRGAAGERAYPTLALDAEDLEELPGIELSPMIFQERVDKALEARVTVVGDQMFVAAVEPGDAVDVREDPALIAGLRAYEGLPDRVRRALFALLDRLCLNFATFDLILTPDGRWVFLEVNTVSFFDHVERHAGLPISDAVADLLLGLRPPRVLLPGRRGAR